MADKPVLSIEANIDPDGSVDAFMEKLLKCKEALSDIPVAWGGTAKMPANPFVPSSAGGGGSGGGASGGGSGKGGKAGAQGALPGSASEFDSAAKASSNPKLSGNSSFIERFRKSSFDSEKAWKSINRELEKSLKGLSGLSRMSLSMGGLGWLGALGGVGAAAGAVVEGAVGAADSLAAQNLKQRQLGLKPGEEQSFDANYQKVGGDSATLATANMVKNNPMEAVKLGAMGISMDQIKQLDTTDLAALMLKQGGQQWNKMGDQAGMYWQRMGLGDFVDPSAAQASGSYLKQDPNAFDKFHAQEQADIPKFAQQQKDQDAATEAKRQLDEALAQDMAALDRAFIKLTPFVVDAANDVAKWVDTFSRSGELDADVKEITDDLHGIAGALTWFWDKLNHGFGDIGGVTHEDPAKQAKDVADNNKKWAESDHKFGSVTRDPSGKSPNFAGDLWNKWKGSGGSASADSDGFIADPNKSATMAALEAKYNLPKGSLQAIENNESSGGKNNRNPKNPNVLGPMQFDEPTAKQYGVTDRMNELQSEIGAARKMRDLYAQYHDWNKAFAAYDGDTHINKDAEANGDDWLKGAKPETTNYLDKMRAQGVDLDDQAANRAEASKYYKSPASADGGQATGSNYGFSMPKPAANPQMTPVALNVTVSTPPGSNANITVGGITA